MRRPPGRRLLIFFAPASRPTIIDIFCTGLPAGDLILNYSILCYYILYYNKVQVKMLFVVVVVVVVVVV